uniref:Uncharacterized protein n=1 Tax=Arundo donax TaxID=35708 RepID=A0A0A9CWK7_ARUDO
MNWLLLKKHFIRSCINYFLMRLFLLQLILPYRRYEADQVSSIYCFWDFFFGFRNHVSGTEKVLEIRLTRMDITSSLLSSFHL